MPFFFKIFMAKLEIRLPKLGKCAKEFGQPKKQWTVKSDKKFRRSVTTKGLLPSLMKRYKLK